MNSGYNLLDFNMITEPWWFQRIKYSKIVSFNDYFISKNL